MHLHRTNAAIVPRARSRFFVTYETWRRALATEVRAASADIGSFAVPAGRLLIVLAVGAGVGVLAAVRPARRAARLDVLTAIAVD